ncbi:MAG: CotH kinase family protein [Clostridia bacterium]|nr:CotH kinase family protein [Clostridia bacterium]
MSEIINTSILRDKNGLGVSMIDQTARDAAAANAEEIGKLTEEIHEIRESMYETSVYSGNHITFDVETNGTVNVVGSITADTEKTVTLVHHTGNLIDVSGSKLYNGVTLGDDGWIVFSKAEGDVNSTKYLNIEIPIQPTIFADTPYKVFAEFETIEVVGESVPGFVLSKSGEEQAQSTPLGTVHRFSDTGIYAVSARTKNNFEGVTLFTQSFVEFPSGCYGSVRVRLWCVCYPGGEGLTNVFSPVEGETYCPYNATVYTNTLEAGHVGEYEFASMPTKRGKNYLDVSDGSIIATVKTVLLGGGGSAAYDPSEYGLPVLALSGDITGMDKDNVVTLNYAYKDRLGTLTCKWQGSSSLSFDKKNYTVKFDNAFEAVEGWGAQKKYCLKANWIDASHARNVVSAKLWGQVVASRTPANATLEACPNYGAVDGFPIIVTLNGEFLGLYTWNIPKDAWMMNMGSGANEAILCADQHVDATRFKAEAVCDGTDFELEYVTDEDNAGWVTTSVNTMINACINSDGNDLDTTVAQYLDLESAIDYMIFVALLDGHDMSDKNYLLSTFDGVKWFFGGYDMDSTYGLWFTGGYFRPATDWLRNFEWWSIHNRAMNLLYNNKRAEIKARYQALRKGALSDDNVVTTFANFIGLIPENVYRAEQERWPEIPNTSTNNLHQIADWYCRRAAYIDKEVNGWTV